MDEDKLKNGAGLIEDSLEFCADIYEYYEDNEDKRHNIDCLREKQKAKADKKNNETVIYKKEEESGLGLYVKILAIVLLAMLLARVVNAYLIQETIVNGSSMSPTLESSDKLLIDKIFFKLGKLERYDVIVFNYNDTSIYIKRIIGLPGDKITIRKGKVYVNGRILDDDPLSDDFMHYAGIAKNGIKLGKDEYFVLGDNRNNSYDSRYEQVGTVKRKNIIGKVFIRIFPISKFGALN